MGVGISKFLIGVLIEPPRQDRKRERPFHRDESAAHEEAGLSRSDLRRLAGADLIDGLDV